MTGPVAIVIFGAAVRADGQPSATLRRRVQAALDFGRQRPGTLYVPTGGVGRHGPAEALVMRDLLLDAGVAPDRVLAEQTGTDTLSSARACTRLLRQSGFAGRVYAASSAYHLPRCVALLRLAGLDAHPCPPPPGPASRRFCKRWYWRLREVPALPYDVGLALVLRLAGRL